MMNHGVWGVNEGGFGCTVNGLGPGRPLSDGCQWLRLRAIKKN